MTDFSVDLPQVFMIISVIIIQIVTLAVLGVCFFKLRRDKRKARRKKALADDRISANPADVLYIQQKPELDAQQERHEIPIDGRTFEVHGDDRFQELTGQEANVPNTAIRPRLHELRGEEHARELDSSNEQ